MPLNFDKIHLFVEGMKQTLNQNIESDKSYEYGLNGRLHSENGKLSYSSVKGTIEVFNNPNIIKYLGYHSFLDELFLIVKYDEKINSLDSNGLAIDIIKSSNFEINIPFGENTHVFTNEFSSRTSEEIVKEYNQLIYSKESLIENNYTDETTTEKINLDDYYKIGDADNYSEFEFCLLNNNNQDIPEYNKDYSDAFILIKKNNDGSLYGNLLWVGNLNLDIDRKIVTIGIDENNNYQRVYFTDNLNKTKSVNLKDKFIGQRNASEFNLRQNTVLLQAEVKEITTGGYINSMTSQYTYRLITENGQVTKFAPPSSLCYIVKNNDSVKFEGGEQEEKTNKKVLIKIPLLDTNFKFIQAVALEYETESLPTNIRNLGIKNVSEIVYFEHNGNESSIFNEITLEDVISTNNNWDYCSSLASEGNTLIAGGLRNTPYTLQEKYIEDLFLFKGWNSIGETHNTLINPNPLNYDHIDITNKKKDVYLNKTLYKDFFFFGNTTIEFVNLLSGDSFSLTINNKEDKYVNFIKEIYNWLIEIDLDLFPNLKIEWTGNSFLFSKENESINTDLFYYQFKTNNEQVIINVENEFKPILNVVDTNNLIYGAQSIGFNNGIGVRLTFNRFKEKLLTKQNELFTNGNLLQLEIPSLKKSFFKDEIYRFSLQLFKNNNPLFSIVLGDLHIPAVGSMIKEVNNGLINIDPFDFYKNQSEEGDCLYAEGITIQAEVRLSCDLKEIADAYQLCYVERTENNRRILAQGISGPMIRIAGFKHPSKSGEKYAPNLYNAWTLPFNGGPLYALNGLWTFDNSGENWNEAKDYSDNWDNTPDSMFKIRRREIVNRKLFYFDSPDIIHERISTNNISNSKINVLGRVKTDHTKHLIRSRFPDDEIHSHYKYIETDETYKEKSFSRKIGYKNISGTENYKPYHFNLSVFNDFVRVLKTEEIEEHSKLMLKGSIIPGVAVNSNFIINNSALTMFAQNAFNSTLWMSGSFRDGKSQYNSESGQSSNSSEGYPTVVIRTKENLFTDDIIGYEVIYSKAHTNDGLDKCVDYPSGNRTELGIPNTDSHLISNLILDNVDSIYGGRNKYAFSNNLFIPISKLIPVIGSKGSNAPQIFEVQGDTYVTLFIRTKNDYSNPLDFNQEAKMHQDNSRSDSYTINDYNRGGGWVYACVLETEVESRFSSDYKLYRSNSDFDLQIQLTELINKSFFNRGNIKSYVPIPFNFKDDPLLTNIIASSEVKLKGDFYDSWSEFPINDFYELEKIKGIISNIFIYENELIVIQETSTNQVSISPYGMINTDSGESISIKKGTGNKFNSHKEISKYGTTIRRAVSISDYGFSFYDEKRNSFIKNIKSLSDDKDLEHYLKELFDNDKVIDTEAYYDDKYKETNILLKTENKKSYLLSFNEAYQVFNGFIEYSNDIYILFDNRIFAPTCNKKEVIVNCPVITSNLSVVHRLGYYFEYQITATENPTLFNALNLPDGLFINKKTGLIYGYFKNTGTYEISIYADNDVCGDQLILVVSVDTLSLSLTIDTGTEIDINFVSIQSKNLFIDINTYTQIFIQLGGFISIEPITMNSETIVDIGFPLPMKFNDYDIQIAKFDNCNLMVYGNFNAYGQLEANSLAKIDLCGNLDDTFQNGIGTGPGNHAAYDKNGVAIDMFGHTYFGGYFTLFNGVSQKYFIKLNPDGTKNTQFDIGIGFNNIAAKPYLTDDEEYVIVPGVFTQYKGSTQNRLIKLDQYGNKVTEFNIGTGFNNTVSQVLKASNGKIWVQGYFSSYNGQTANRIVLIDEITAQRDFSFNIPIAPNNTGNYQPMNIDVDESGLIITSAYGITECNGVSVPKNIFKLNLDGSLNTEFNSNAGVGLDMESECVFYDADLDKYVITTNGSTYNNIPVKSVFRLNKNGTIDNSFELNLNLPNELNVRTLTKIGAKYYATMCRPWDHVDNDVLIISITETGEAKVLMNNDSCKEENFMCYPDNYFIELTGEYEECSEPVNSMTYAEPIILYFKKNEIDMFWEGNNNFQLNAYIDSDCTILATKPLNIPEYTITTVSGSIGYTIGNNNFEIPIPSNFIIKYIDEFNEVYFKGVFCK